MPTRGFGKNARNRDGLESQCRFCMVKYGRQRRQKNRERLNAQHREYWARNADKLNERRRARANDSAEQ